MCTNKHHVGYSSGGTGGRGASTRWTSVVSFTPRPLYSPRHRRRYLLNRRFGRIARRSPSFVLQNISQWCTRNLKKAQTCEFLQSMDGNYMTQWRWRHLAPGRSSTEKRVLTSIPLTPGYVLNAAERISFTGIWDDVMIRYDRPPSCIGNTHTDGVRNLSP